MPWDRNRPRSADYGTAHAKARREAAKRHDPADPCSICGHPLGPMGRWLHYDHSPDRATYRGFAHGAPCPWCSAYAGKPVRCNQRDGAKRGRERQNVIRIRL